MASGLDEAVFKNIEACCDLAEITRTSLGPNGKSKLIINHLEKLFLTNDANTILSELDIVHPAAKLILLAANQQHAEFGDMSNLILVLSGDLLNNALVLLQLGLLPASIIDGYALAHKLMVPIMDSLVIDSINLKDLANSLEKVSLFNLDCKSRRIFETIRLPIPPHSDYCSSLHGHYA